MTKSLKQTFHAHKKRVIKCLIHTCEMFHLYSDAKKKKKKLHKVGLNRQESLYWRLAITVKTILKMERDWTQLAGGKKQESFKALEWAVDFRREAGQGD